MKYKLEYIWLDGYEPVPNLRGKTKIEEFDAFPTARGAAAVGLRRQLDAPGRGQQLGLPPASRSRIFPDPARNQRRTRHVRGAAARRHAAPEQQPRDDPRRSRHVVRVRAGVLPLPGRRAARLPGGGLPAAAGRVLHRRRLQERRRHRARDRRRRTSTSASRPASTTRASTPRSPRASGSSRSSARAPRRAADEVWIARYLLLRLCERYGVDVNFHCKPLGMDVDWNGSGMHTNFSTKHMREVGGKEYFEALMAAFDEYKDEHIAVYGPDNHLRLTGLHETQSIDKFNYGVADRGASVRVPHSFVNNGYKRLSRRSPSELAGRPVPDRRPDPADDRGGHRAGADRGRVRSVGVNVRDLRPGDWPEVARSTRRGSGRGTRPSRPWCRRGRHGTQRTWTSTASLASVTGASWGGSRLRPSPRAAATTASPRSARTSARARAARAWAASY